jgi:hypothetical protein
VFGGGVEIPSMRNHALRLHVGAAMPLSLSWREAPSPLGVISRAHQRLHFLFFENQRLKFC